MKIVHHIRPLITLGMTAITLFCVDAAPSRSGPLELDLRRLRQLDTGLDQWEPVTNHVQWEPARHNERDCHASWQSK
jgi:hypothetical protein